MFNPDDAKDRIAELGKLLGPIIVRDCGPDGLAGEVFYTERTVGEERRLSAIQRKYPETATYRELMLRAKDREADRIWDDDELDDVLRGGIDPIDAAYIVGSMYAGDKAERPDVKSGPFSREAARQLFEDNQSLYGPVMIPHLGADGEPLEAYYWPNDGIKDCAIAAMKRKHPDDWSLRLLIERARTREDKALFKIQHLPTLASALMQDELNTVTASMMHPRFMPEQVRIDLAVAQEANEQPHVDDLKN